MALKGNRHIFKSDITYFMNEVAERGGMTVYSGSGSGAAMDQAIALVTYTVVSGSKPAGLLLCDMVNYDLTRQHLNHHKNEMQMGSKVEIMTHGWVVTNKIAAGIQPAAGQAAYMVISGSGNLSTSASQLPVQASLDRVGRFLSGKDEDGYAKVEINLT